VKHPQSSRFAATIRYAEPPLDRCCPIVVYAASSSSSAAA